MTKIRLLPEAEEELRAAARFYEALQPGLGLALLLRFPYRVYYRVRPDEIVIVAVGHRRQRPGFWRKRT